LVDSYLHAPNKEKTAVRYISYMLGIYSNESNVSQKDVKRIVFLLHKLSKTLEWCDYVDLDRKKYTFFESSRNTNVALEMFCKEYEDFWIFFKKKL
jgi:hypothetical protein